MSHMHTHYSTHAHLQLLLNLATHFLGVSSLQPNAFAAAHFQIHKSDHICLHVASRTRTVALRFLAVAVFGFDGDQMQNVTDQFVAT